MNIKQILMTRLKSKSFIFCNLGNLLDTVTTIIFVSMLGPNYEANNFVRYLILSVGIFPTALIKMVYVGTVSLIVPWNWLRWGWGILFFAAGVWNTYWIIHGV